MKPSCAAAAVWCPAYCHEIGYDAYDASKKLTRQFFVVVLSWSYRSRIATVIAALDCGYV